MAKPTKKQKVIKKTKKEILEQTQKSRQKIIDTVNKYQNEVNSINLPAKFVKPTALIQDNLTPLLDINMYIPGVADPRTGLLTNVEPDLFPIPYNNVSSFNYKTTGQGMGSIELKIMDSEFFVSEGLLARFKALNGKTAPYLKIQYGWASSEEMERDFSNITDFTNEITVLITGVDYDYQATQI